MMLLLLIVVKMDALVNHLTEAATLVEQQVDAEIERLEHLDEDDLEKLRNQRLSALKKSQQQKQKWQQLGHGQYEEIAEEKDFFDICKKSRNVVCHFYRESTMRCKIIDKHLTILAPKHIETHFVKIYVEKCPFLVKRLRIVVLPTLCLSRDGKTVDYVVGFDDLGGRDDFDTEVLEWRIARADVINYNGDLLTPPGEQPQKKSILGHQASEKTIRQRYDNSSDEDDYA